MIQAKSEVTVKFYELPTNTTVEGQNSTFEVVDNGITYRISCKTKALNKVAKTVATFKHPFVVAAAAKKISNPQKDLVVLDEVGIQVFEKVPKEVKQSEQS